MANPDILEMLAPAGHDIASADHDVDAFADRDREPELPAPLTVVDARKPPQQTRPPRWTVPLECIIGDEEPDEDDSADWLVRDVVPRGEPVMLHGPPKSGKTWLALDLAIAVALGSHWLDGDAENTIGAPARTLVLALEDHERRLRRRIWELSRGRGMTPNDPTLRGHLAVSRARVRIPDAADVRDFTAELKAWKPALVIIDNITRTMQGDPNATRDAAAFSASWGNICVDTGAAVLFLHHSRKPSGERGREDDTLDGSRGSGDLVAAARHVMRMRPLAGDSGKSVGELTARGNLDIRRAARALELVRETNAAGKTSARLVDRGDPADIKRELGVVDLVARVRDAARSQRDGFANRTALAKAVKGRREQVLCTIAEQLEAGGCLIYRDGAIVAKGDQ